MKKCTICKVRKSSKSFHKDVSRYDGLCAKCKKCSKQLKRKYYIGHKDNISECNKKWRAKNRDKVRSYIAKWYRKNKQKCLELARKNNAKYRKLPENMVKNNCRAKTRYAIKAGNIKKRNICEMCLAPKTQCHHEDYNDHLDFIELCRRCHAHLHRTNTY